MTQYASLQDYFLNTLLREKGQVSIYLVNGIKLLGQVEAFDDCVVILTHNHTSQVVYKHSISTIVPAQPTRINWILSKQSQNQERTEV